MILGALSKKRVVQNTSGSFLGIINIGKNNYIC
jgi:hypothetical protein